MATEKAPVALTGGAGFEFDDCVAARFMIDLLQARCSLAAELGAVAKIVWEDRPAWLADDLVLSCRKGELESVVDALTQKDPIIGGISFNPGLRPVLRNLKILDWAARAVRAGALMGPDQGRERFCAHRLAVERHLDRRGRGRGQPFGASDGHEREGGCFAQRWGSSRNA